MDKLRVKNSGFVSLVVGANASHAKGEPFVLFLLRGTKKHKPVLENNSFKKEKQKRNLVSLAQLLSMLLVSLILQGF